MNILLVLEKIIWGSFYPHLLRLGAYCDIACSVLLLRGAVHCSRFLVIDSVWSFIFLSFELAVVTGP